MFLYKFCKLDKLRQMSFIDTHCHLNFKAFSGGESKIIRRAVDVGVSKFVIPGTDIPTSQKAVEIAQKNPGAYAVVGIHPHHIHNYTKTGFEAALSKDIEILKDMLKNLKVLGIGEVGLDRHTYFASRHGNGVEITQEVFEMQKMLFLSQAILAKESKKCLVIHNREAKDDLIGIINDNEDIFKNLINKVVLHCCEPEQELLELAKKYSFFIGIDGDVTFDESKQEFVKKIPMNMLLLETDSPYILPEPLKSQKKYPNVPANVPLIASCISTLLKIPLSEVEKQTTLNAERLFAFS